jgi:hypothetical protein
MQQGCVLNRTINIDDKVIGAFGPQTLLQARGESVEKLISTNGSPRLSSGVFNATQK